MDKAKDTKYETQLTGPTQGFVQGEQNSVTNIVINQNALERNRPTEQQQDHPTSFPINNIPYPCNPYFTGRDELLTQLAAALRTEQPAALSQPQAINGLGGVGKTQIALEYAYRYLQDYQAVLWARADTREALVSGFVAITGLLDLPEKDEQDQTATVKAALKWLKTHTRWLLILDNADDLAMVREFLPLVFKGHILLTTRAQAMGRLANRIEVDAMDLDTGALFLLRRARLLTQHALLEEASSSDGALAREICEELGGLPLALDQAGGYVEETQCSLSDYQQRYRTRRALLLKRRGGLVTDHPEPVATTWSLAFEKVEQQSSAAADLLRLCAFLHPDTIPEEIILEGAAHLGPLLQPIREDAFLLDDIITTLGAYSLLRRDATNKMLSIHRLVQTVLKDAMDQQTQQQWAQRTVQAVSKAFPHVEFTMWQQCERCLPHTQVCAALIKQWEMTFEETRDLLDRAGTYLYERAQYKEAALLLQQVLSIYEQIEPNKPNVAKYADKLAKVYHAQGQYKRAEELYQRALTILKRTMGGYHTDVANALNSLAYLYQEQGLHKRAATLYQRAQDIYEEILRFSRGHAVYRISLDNSPGLDERLYDLSIVKEFDMLAAIYATQGRYEQATSFYQRSLAIRERELGSNHLDVIPPLKDLASVYHTRGKYERAVSLLERAQIIGEHTETGSLSTADILYDLADIYCSQRQYEQAVPLFLDSLAFYEHAKGPNHPDVIDHLHALASCYLKLGHYKQAEPLLLRALTICEQVLESNHSKVIENITTLAFCYTKQAHYEQAMTNFNRAIALGDTRASTFTRRGETYLQMEFYTEALVDLDRAIELEEKDDWTWYCRAKIHLIVGQLDAFAHDIQIAIELTQAQWKDKPHDYQAGFNLALYHLVSGREEDVKAQHEQLIPACTSVGLLQDALTEITNVLTLLPSNALAPHICARLQERLAELRVANH